MKTARQLDREIREAIRESEKPAAATTPETKKARSSRPKTKAKRGPLDLSLVPGTPKEQMALARSIMVRGGKPLAIVKDGDRWRVVILGVDIGSVDSKHLATSAVHQVGRYRLDLGDFVHTYADGVDR